MSKKNLPIAPDFREVSAAEDAAGERMRRAIDSVLQNWADGIGTDIAHIPDNAGVEGTARALETVSKESFIQNLTMWEDAFVSLSIRFGLATLASFTALSFLRDAAIPPVKKTYRIFYWLAINDRAAPLVKFGITDNLKRRLDQHAPTGFTSCRYVEVDDARLIENAFKKFLGRKETVTAAAWRKAFGVVKLQHPNLSTPSMLRPLPGGKQ